MKFDDVIPQIVDRPLAKPKAKNIRPAISILPEDSDKLGELVAYVYKKTQTKTSKSRVLHNLIGAAHDSIQ